MVLTWQTDTSQRRSTLTRIDVVNRVLSHYDPPHSSQVSTLDPVLVAIISELVLYITKRCIDRHIVSSEGPRAWLARRVAKRRMIRHLRPRRGALEARGYLADRLAEAVIQAGRSSHPEEIAAIPHLLV